MVIAVTVVTVGAALAVPVLLDNWRAAADQVKPITHVPANDHALGLVYTGLVPAKKGDPCVGAYQVADRNTCTHGPDAPPPGIDFSRAAVPVAPAQAEPVVPKRDTAAGPSESDLATDDGALSVQDSTPSVVPDATPADAAALVNGIVCDGDGLTGKRVQVMYVHGSGTPSRYGQFLESFRTWAAGVDAIYDASAQETGGSRHVRFVTTSDCKVDVPEVEIGDTAIATFDATITALRGMGFNRTDRKYLMFADSDVYCGIGTLAGDDKAGSTNRNNVGPSYARADKGCWTAAVAGHELGHNLGAVANSAPNSSKAGHCVDEFDLMCYKDTPTTVLRTACTDRAHDNRLDCNHDDYYNTNPSAGSYLASHWNVANNDFLIRGDGGGGPGPTPTPSPTRTNSPSPTGSPTGSPTPTTSPTRTNSPSPTGSPTGSPTPTPTLSPTGTPTPSPTGGTGLKPLRVSDTTANSTRLSWDAAAAGTRYAVLLGGRSLGTVRSTSVRVVGMRPDTDYRFQIATVAANGTRTPYTETVTVHTAQSAPVTSGKWMFLGNAWTGRVADLFGSRSADGTPLVLYRRNGGANQQWRLEPAGTGYLLRSKATDRCAVPLGGSTGSTAAGVPLVQAACDAVTAGVWHVATTPYGVTLSTTDGLVIGVSAQRFGGSRLLVLQRPTGARYQSWTAQAG